MNTSLVKIKSRLSASLILVILKQIPITLTLFLIIFILSFLTGNIMRDSFPEIMQNFGLSLPALLSGRIWVAWISLFFSNIPGIRPTMHLMLLLGMGTLEYRYGSRIAAFAFLVLGPLISILTLILFWPFASQISSIKVALYTPDMGSSSASLFCWGMALVGDFKNRINRILISTTVVILIGLLFLIPKPYDLDHLIAFSLGLVIGELILTKWET